MSVSFGDLVRRGREEAGLSQSRLALLIGKSPTTIRAWEHGRTNPADPASVAALAAVLGLNEAELLGQAGFEVPVARARPSARQELSNLASERTEMIALAPLSEPHAPPTKLVKASILESDLLDSVQVEAGPMEQVAIDQTKADSGADLVAEVEVDVTPVITAPIPIAAAPAPVAEPKVRIPKPKLATPRPRPAKPRVIVTRQVVPGSGPTGANTPIGSNGYVGGRSYLEDEVEKDFYRRRGLITALVLVFMVIVIWWALGRTGGAIGDLIESIVGLLDI